VTLHGGTWTKFANPPWYRYGTAVAGEVPNSIFLDQRSSVGFGHVLMDGSVIIDAGRGWYRLTPNRQGSYLNGIWTRITDRPVVRSTYASTLMGDGRLMCVYGEFGADASTGLSDLDIYDPDTDTWSRVTPSWSLADMWDSDNPVTILADGKVLIGTGYAESTFVQHKQSMVYDPATNLLTQVEDPTFPMLETSLQLLQNGNVLHYCGNGTSTLGAETYDPATQLWTSTATPPNIQAVVDLVNYFIYDMGRTLLMHNGDVYILGNLDGRVAKYSAAGAWSLATAMPIIAGQTYRAAQMDQPAVVMCNGNALVAAGEYPPTDPFWNGPCKWLEFDGTTWGELATQPTPGLNVNYWDFAIPLPDGNVLCSNSARELFLFTPTSKAPPPTSRPVISSIVNSVGATVTTLSATGGTYTVKGTRLNGCTTGAGNKDENSVNTNFPIVRLEYVSGVVVYCPTSNPRLQSTGATYMGVDPTASTQADFTIPQDAPNGSATLVVVASGIGSIGVAVTITNAGATYSTPLTVSGGVGAYYGTYNSRSDWWDGIFTRWYPLEGSRAPRAGSTYPNGVPTITASGGTAPYSYALHPTSVLPDGVTFHSDATGAWLEGYPTASMVISGQEWPQLDGSLSYVESKEHITIIATDALGVTGELHLLVSAENTSPVAFVDDNLGMTDMAGVAGTGFQTRGDDQNLTDSTSTAQDHVVDLGQKHSRLING
jgi:hypothetical protein